MTITVAFVPQPSAKKLYSQNINNSITLIKISNKILQFHGSPNERNIVKTVKSNGGQIAETVK